MFKIKNIVFMFIIVIISNHSQDLMGMQRPTSLLKRLKGWTATSPLHKYYKKLSNQEGGMNYCVGDPLSGAQSFVLEVVKETYPELKDQALFVQANYKNFAATGATNTRTGLKLGHFIAVPFNEEELIKAKYLKEEGAHVDLEQTYEAARDQLLKKQGSLNENATPSEKIASLEECGYACTPATLDVWKSIIMHEAGHIINKDCDPSVSRLFDVFHTICMQPPLLYVTLMSPLMLNPKLSLLLAGSVIVGYRNAYKKERRADQEVIERAKDPNMLRAISKHYNGLSQAKTVYFAKRNIIFDMSKFLQYHPSNKKRAAYFAKAAEELEKKLEKN